jgi:hypothetical protein
VLTSGVLNNTYFNGNACYKIILSYLDVEIQMFHAVSNAGSN